jgi:hypothetical protein
MRPNRPHIPSLHQIFKELSSDKKRAIRQFLGVSLRALPSDFPNFTLRLTVASVRHRHVSASVRRYLRRPPGSRKSKKHDLVAKILQKPENSAKSCGWRKKPHKRRGAAAIFLRLQHLKLASGRHAATHSTFGNQSQCQ